MLKDIRLKMIPATLALILLAGCAGIGPGTVERDRFDYVNALSELLEETDAPQPGEDTLFRCACIPGRIISHQPVRHRGADQFRCHLEEQEHPRRQSNLGGQR